jgi:UDP-N-acetylglucosamine 2-epimerase
LGIEEGLRHYGQGGCDTVAAWGETSREYFLRVGVPDRKIIITGNPRFDQLARADFSAEAGTIRAELGYAPGDFMLTFLSSPIERMLIVSKEEKREALIHLLGWIRTLRAEPAGGNLHLVLKLHRAEDAGLFREMIAEAGATDFARVAEHPLYPLLKASQAALMFSTTAGLEAALLQVPVGILGLSKRLDDWNFISRGVAANVRSPEGLAAFLRRAREDDTFGARGANAAAFYLANPGRAAQAVADAVARMAGFEGSHAAP